jgi:hypothetical protein
LVTALHGTVAFTQVQDLAMAVGEDLELDVTWVLDVFLDVDGAIAERLLCFGACNVILLGEGKPILRATLTASVSDSTGPSDPGTVGTPALRTVSLAIALSPMILILFDLGPMNLMLQDSHCSANLAFSDRNP